MSKKPDPRELAKQRQEQADRDFVAVANTPEGMRVLWRLMVATRVFDASWSASAQIHYNEGRRSAGLDVLNNLSRLCPDRYLEMVRTYVDEIKVMQAKAAEAREQIADPE